MNDRKPPVMSAQASPGRGFVVVSVDDGTQADLAEYSIVLLTEQEARDLARDIRMTLRDMAEARRR